MTTDLAVSGIAGVGYISDTFDHGLILSGAAADLGLQVNTGSAGPAGPAEGNFTIPSGFNAELFGASQANITVEPDSYGTLRLDDSAGFAGTVAGLGLGTGGDSGYVDFMDLPFQGNTAVVATPNADKTGGNVAVTEGGRTVNLALLGNYLATTFSVSSDGGGGTQLYVDTPVPALAQPQVLAPSH